MKAEPLRAVNYKYGLDVKSIFQIIIIVYIIDAFDRERFSESKEELDVRFSVFYNSCDHTQHTVLSLMVLFPIKSGNDPIQEGLKVEKQLEIASS